MLHGRGCGLTSEPIGVTVDFPEVGHTSVVQTGSVWRDNGSGVSHGTREFASAIAGSLQQDP